MADGVWVSTRSGDAGGKSVDRIFGSEIQALMSAVGSSDWGACAVFVRWGESLSEAVERSSKVVPKPVVKDEKASK